jgi:hypothetical protein
MPRNAGCCLFGMLLWNLPSTVSSQAVSQSALCAKPCLAEKLATLADHHFRDLRPLRRQIARKGFSNIGPTTAPSQHPSSEEPPGQSRIRPYPSLASIVLKKGLSRLAGTHGCTTGRAEGCALTIAVDHVAASGGTSAESSVVRWSWKAASTVTLDSSAANTAWSSIVRGSGDTTCTVALDSPTAATTRAAVVGRSGRAAWAGRGSSGPQ